MPFDESVTPLCSLEYLKAALGIASDETSDDAKFTALIQMASGQIAAWCGRDFKVVDITDELRDGDDSALLTLVHTPIVSVSALSIDGQVIDPAEAKVYPNYIKFDDSGEYSARLRSSGRIFPAGCQNVKVSYRAGYSVIPAEISDACVGQVAFLMNTLTKQGLLNETNQVAQATTGYAQVALAPAVKVACNRYRRSRVAVV
jgi:hypothetical protein